MKNLYKYITEGGAAGHMAHPYDYVDFTLRDIKGLIRNLFTAKIDDVTEKIDGLNIVASMNNDGEVIFIRNKGDLNSSKGGMSIQDMASKWSDRPSVAKTYTDAGEIITKVFNKIGPKFFNPDPDTRVAVNCECVVAGVTNIMPYSTSQVDFHNLFIYKKGDSSWEHTDTTKDGLNVINKACDRIDGAQLTPQILIKITKESENILVSFIKEIDKLWKKEGLKEYDTIDQYKQHRFYDWCKNNAEWILNGNENVLYSRWLNGDKSINIRQIKQCYPDHIDELTSLDKTGYKDMVSMIGEPLDTFFSKLGNAIIKQCDGFINSGVENEVISQLRNDLNDVVKTIRSGDDQEIRSKLDKQLTRLEKLGNEINPVEGIVFNYKGKLMKCTGSFASLNKIVNFKYMNKI